MKAFTVKDSLTCECILRNIKNIENRDYSFNYTGWVFLHCGYNKSSKNKCQTLSLWKNNPKINFDNYRGYIIGIVFIDKILKRNEVLDNEWVSKEYCHLISKTIRLLNPIKCRGNIGIWEIPNNIYLEIKKKNKINKNML